MLKRFMEHNAVKKIKKNCIIVVENEESSIYYIYIACLETEFLLER